MNRMDIRRRMLESLSNKVIFSYTGSYDFSGDEYKGYLRLTTSGTLTIRGKVDLCLLGGGGRGRNGYHSGSTAYGGGGGAGGFVENFFAQNMRGSFGVTLGAGSTTQGVSGSPTTVGASYTANGGNSDTNGDGAVGRGHAGYWSGSATAGEKGVFPFNDPVNFASYRVSGCGGGGGYKTKSGDSTDPPGAGGLGGGGRGGYYNGAGVAGTANMGGGGGGGGVNVYKDDTYAGGAGGLGAVFIRWGYNDAAQYCDLILKELTGINRAWYTGAGCSTIWYSLDSGMTWTNITTVPLTVSVPVGTLRFKVIAPSGGRAYIDTTNSYLAQGDILRVTGPQTVESSDIAMTTSTTFYLAKF